MSGDKKELKRGYRERARAMGVFAIRNMVDEKVFVGVGMDLQGIMNRHRFELEMGGHRNQRLQADWNELGAERFAFEILDQLEPGQIGEAELRGELKFLEELWLEKLQPYGERGYNEPKLTREEKLRRIHENQRRED